MDKPHYTIGFASLTEKIPFAVKVRESVEAAAALHPELTLIVRDNDQDNDRALANIQAFADIPVDLAMIYHVDERFGPSLRGVLAQKGIPVIAISIPIPLTVFFGVDNRQAGLLAGEALGKWIQANWNRQVDKVLVMTNTRTLEVVRQRLDYALKSLNTLLGFDPKTAFHVDSSSDRVISAQRARHTLETWREFHHIAAVCINDESALGVLDAARELGRESDVAVIGQNASLAAEAFRLPSRRFVASVAYYPERFGPGLIDLALRMLKGERVPRENLLEPTLVTIENFETLSP